MAYRDILFPTTIAEGARGGRRWSTDLVMNRGGYSTANANWSAPLGVWDIGMTNRTLSETRILQRFFHAVGQGKLHSFRYYDRKDSIISNVLMTRLTSTTYQMRQLYRMPPASALAVVVTKPVPNDNTLVITFGGAEVLDYTVDTATGIVTFGTAVDSATQVRVKQGAYHMHVRFDTDEFTVEETSQGMFSWPSIKLVEVR